MDKIYSLDDLPQFSEWPAKLLAIKESKKFHKNRKTLDREYDKQKWKTLLDEALILKKKVTLREVEKVYFGNNQCLCYNRGKFKSLKLIDAQIHYQQIVANFVSDNIKNYSSIAELGCGYGSIIIDLAKRKKFKDIKFLAADFSDNGCKLTKFIAECEKTNLDVFHCDFLNKPIANKTLEDSVILTSYAVICIPHLPDDFIQSLLNLKHQVVVHFEPIYEHCDIKTLFGQIRRKYIEVNDYNQDLLTKLKQAEKSKKIKILKVEKSVFGANPLLPVSIIVWKPTP